MARVEVTVNGDARSLPEGTTLEGVVRESGAPPDARGLAVALDGEVVPRREWGELPLRSGQRVEVLQAVQGG